MATYGKVSWNDKPVLTTSADGRHVYVSWNGPHGRRPVDGRVARPRARRGRRRRPSTPTATTSPTTPTVLPDGTVVFSEGSLTYTRPRRRPRGRRAASTRSSPRTAGAPGATWSSTRCRSASRAPTAAAPTTTSGTRACPRTPAATLVYAYDGATEPFGPQRIYVRRSSDGGATWSARPRSRSPARTPPHLCSSSRADATCGSPTSRRRAATTPTVGTSGSATPATADARGAHR